jgi:hypothetical protein
MERVYGEYEYERCDLGFLESAGGPINPENGKVPAVEVQYPAIGGLSAIDPQLTDAVGSAFKTHPPQNSVML